MQILNGKIIRGWTLPLRLFLFQWKCNGHISSSSHLELKLPGLKIITCSKSVNLLYNNTITDISTEIITFVKEIFSTCVHFTIDTVWSGKIFVEWPAHFHLFPSVQCLLLLNATTIVNARLLLICVLAGYISGLQPQPFLVKHATYTDSCLV